MNWEALSAVGTVSSSFVALIALLITLRLSYSESRKSKPCLKVSKSIPKGIFGGGYFFVRVVNISHVKLRITNFNIMYYCPHESQKLLPLSSRIASRLSVKFPFLNLKFGNVSEPSSLKPKCFNFFYFSEGGITMKPDNTLSDHFKRYTPDEFTGEMCEHGEMTVAVRIEEFLKFVEYEISKPNQAFAIRFSTHTGRDFSTGPIRLKRLNQGSNTVITM
jgi:hypothetical protein